MAGSIKLQDKGLKKVGEVRMELLDCTMPSTKLFNELCGSGQDYNSSMFAQETKFTYRLVLLEFDNKQSIF